MKINTKTTLLFIMSFALIAIIGVSYAYFTAAIVNNEVKDQVVSTGTLSLRYVDGPEVVMQNIKPGQTITKTVYVANTGTLDAVYNLVWQELTNEITNDEMLIEGTCTRMNATTETEDGICDAITSASISSNTIKSKITIEPSIVHKYDLTITFKDTNAAQNYNQGKKFSGVLGVEEYKLVAANFATDSWATIAANVKAGNGSSYTIGDIKEIDLGDLGKHNVRLANTSTPSECSTEGFSQTACGFVVEFEDIITTHAMNSTATNVGGWPSSSLYSYVNTDIYNMLPADLKNVITETTVVSGHGSDVTENFTSSDKLYLLEPKEVYTDFAIEDSYTASNSTRTLDYYANNGVTLTNCSNVIKKLGTNANPWWMRTANLKVSSFFYNVSTTGNSNFLGTATSTHGVSPAFRIG